MTNQMSTSPSTAPRHTIRRLSLMGVSSFAALFATSIAMPAYADITNDATAHGTYGAGPATDSNTDHVAIPVAPAAPALTVTKSAGVPTKSGGSDTGITDAGDTITYTFTVKNTGNVTLTGVSPVDNGITFNGAAGTNTLGAYSPLPSTVTLKPNESQTFTADYTLSQVDVDHAAGITGGVSNTASATATAPGPGGATVTATNTPPATTTIAAGPQLSIVKKGVLTDISGGTTGKADVGETITYTYTVTNTGNVALNNVSVADTHEGALLAAGTVAGEALVTDGPLATAAQQPATSTDTPTGANDGVWGVLQPGATIKFTYSHIVTQTEVDGG